MLLGAGPSAAARTADSPPWLHPGLHAGCDGWTDDLLTRGLGAAGMLGDPPGYADPLHPTAAELRRSAPHLRGSAGQDFGRLFGPNVDHATGQALPLPLFCTGDLFYMRDVGPDVGMPCWANLDAGGGPSASCPRLGHLERRWAEGG